MTIRKLSFVGVLTAAHCLLLPPAVRLAGAQTAAKPASPLPPPPAARTPGAPRPGRRRLCRVGGEVAVSVED